MFFCAIILPESATRLIQLPWAWRGDGCGKDFVSVLGRDEGYTVKYNLLPEGVPEGEA